MDFFEKKAAKAAKAESEKLPSWVDKNNASHAAYKAVQQLKFEKLTYIREHCRKTHYKLKGSWKIVGSEIARMINIATPTLLSTSTYSSHFNAYLKTINLELEKAKDTRLEKTAKNKARGPVALNKNELVDEVKKYKKESEKYKKLNAEQQAEISISRLPPALKALYLDPKFSQVTALNDKRED